MQVVKVGGRVQGAAALIDGLVAAWNAGDPFCVVHGGGDEISSLQQRLGLTPTFVGGRRVTSADELEIVRMALSGSANKRMVGALISAGVPAIGISGEDGPLLIARPKDRGALGYVGTPETVDPAPLRAILAGGFLPVISPVARAALSEAGAPSALNVNGDDAAAAIAAALESAELLFVADVAGVMIDGVVAQHLDIENAEHLITSGQARGGMEPKLRAAASALAGGVHRVRIGGVDMLSDPHAGTTIEFARSLT